MTVLIAYIAGTALATGAAFFPSAGWAYLTLIAFVGFSLGLLRTSPVTFILFAPLIALRGTEILSGAAIENGAYMIETAAYGRPTGAFTHLFLIYVGFFGVAALTVEAMWPRLRAAMVSAPELWERNSNLLFYGLLVYFAASSVFLVTFGMANGFPLFDNIDRFRYLKEVASPTYQAWLANRAIFVPFVGMLFALPAYRWRALGMLVWLIAFSVIFGEKFTSLLQILSIFIMPAALVHIANGRLIPFRAVAALVAAITIVTVPAVLIVYGALTDFNGAVNRYGIRAALQGQLWFQIDRRYGNVVNWQPEPIAADVKGWFTPAAQVSTIAGDRYGLYYVMEPITPAYNMDAAVDYGGGYVFSLYPYLLMVSGYVGLVIVSTLLAAYHAWIAILLGRGLASANWLASLVLGRVIASIYSGYSTGYLWTFFGIKTLGTLFAGCILLYVFRRRGQTRVADPQPGGGGQ